MKVFYASCGGGWIHISAAQMFRHGHEAWLYSPSKNWTGLPETHFKRCAIFHYVWQPFNRILRGRYGERAFHMLFPIWKAWLAAQEKPACDVVHSVMAFASEPFEYAERTGALKVLDASNSHPTSFYGFWQRELDVWNPGTRVALPRRIFFRANREIERADLVLCASNYVRDTMLYNGIPESKLAVNPFGADLAVFSPRVRLPEKPRFLFVGLLTVRKGIQYLMPAFEKLKKEHPEAELIVCGGLYPDFRELFPRWQHLFTYHRGLPHPELSALMRSCTALVFPSIEEGFARVIAEAMASGLPVIATHNSGASTVVEHGREGFIVPARSIDEVYRAMKELILRPDLCESMGRAAAERMQTGSWNDYGRRLGEIYQVHLDRKRSGAAARG
jgi:glycosyltransferase involved in cell wall biosynthesis